MHVSMRIQRRGVAGVGLCPSFSSWNLRLSLIFKVDIFGPGDIEKVPHTVLGGLSFFLSFFLLSFFLSFVILANLEGVYSLVWGDNGSIMHILLYLVHKEQHVCSENLSQLSLN